MPTSVKLDPLAQQHADALKAALEAEFGIDATQRDIICAAVYGATAAQLVGMLMEFIKARQRAEPAPRAAARAPATADDT